MVSALPFTFSYNLFCPFSAESTEASTLSVLPGPGDIPCIDCNAKIFLWLKAPDLLLPHGNNGKSGSLHPAAGKLSIILTGKRSCTIHSNQPVCLCSCNRRPVKVVISSSVFQIVKSVFDGLIRNRGYPQSAYGLTAAGFIQDPAGNQLALSSCVCGNDNVSYVLSEKLSFYCIVLFTCLADSPQASYDPASWEGYSSPISYIFCHIPPDLPGLTRCPRAQVTI